jgi:hypothetical protein
MKDVAVAGKQAQRHQVHKKPYFVNLMWAACASHVP